MRKVVVIVAALPLVSLMLLTPETSAQKKSEQKTGSIKGKISVRGVRSPENVLVYIEKASGEYPAPKELAKMDQKKLVFFSACAADCQRNDRSLSQQRSCFAQCLLAQEQGRGVQGAKSRHMGQRRGEKIHLQKGRHRCPVV